MNLTPYHAKFFALDITKKCFADNIEKIIPVLSDAKVDLNPHQIEAALFAFKSPFSKGAILADEVGLGKTIEAGLVISQNWAERKRKILIIVPASLRKQWSTELVEKFYLPSVIMESKSFNQAIKDGHFNPFESADIVITSYNFAKQKVDYIKHINWDLVVIDEAHRLRNVYKNNNKMAKAIKEAVSPFKKILLTATPLQNSLLELFGLVGFIDENIFGDINAFRSLYVRNGDNINNDYIDLQARLKPICIRTLRRQVIEYINYTKRIAFTQEFTPNPDEQSLYDVVSDYLSGQSLYALPNSQRHLITLIMRKLLASSSFAITETLKSLISRLEKIEQRVNEANSSENNIDLNDILDEDVSEIYIDESESEESEIEDNSNLPLTKEQWRAFQKEIKDLRKYLQIAEGIQVNAKGDALLIALQTGFAKMKELGAAQKAVIFTESRRTQEYVNGLLTHYGYNVVQFNGSNNDAKSNSIYKQWVETHKGTSVVTGSQTDKTNFIGIGINCLKYFSFRYREHIDNEDKYTSYFGSPSNIKENEDIKLSISIYGSNLSFYFNDILAFQKTISLPLLNNQIGVFCSSTDKISIDNFRIDNDKRKIFVVMQFGEEYDELYKDVIYEVSHNKYNFDVIRVDESYKACTIVSDIIRYITEASVIIADISPDNLNVFYELGYAHALNKPTILLCDKNLRKELPFDIHDFRTIFYENSIHGKKDIEEKLSRFLENI